MMTTTHTPGPWYLHERDTDPPYGWKVLAGCEQGNDELEESEIADTYEPTSFANARLLAAAPDLLEACEALLSTPALNFDDLEDADIEAIERARAAIAKATV